MLKAPVRIAVAGTATLLLLSAAPAFAVKVTPGLWKMDYKVTMPFLGEPRMTSVEECITKGELNPEDLNQETENPCEFTNVVNSDEEISWSMSCPNPGGSAEGRWTFRSQGDTMAGEGEMVMAMNGQEFTMTMTMDAQRVGSCEG